MSYTRRAKYSVHFPNGFHWNIRRWCIDEWYLTAAPRQTGLSRWIVITARPFRRSSVAYDALPVLIWLLYMLWSSHIRKYDVLETKGTHRNISFGFLHIAAAPLPPVISPRSGASVAVYEAFSPWAEIRDTAIMRMHEIQLAAIQWIYRKRSDCEESPCQKATDTVKPCYNELQGTAQKFIITRVRYIEVH